MKLLATVATVAALLGTAGLADNNELFVTQAGNDNFVGDANNPVEQNGTSNYMDISQTGNGNTVGSRATSEPALPTWPGATQTGSDHEMTIVQSGHRNKAELLQQRGGNKNTMEIRQSGNDNRIVNAHQYGDKNTFDVRQSGNENYGNSLQVGDQNIIEVRTSGHRNTYDLNQGSFSANACTKCDIELIQGGNDNAANVYQQDLNQMASINQSGNGNTVYTSQAAN